MGGDDDGRVGLPVALDELGDDLRRYARLVGQDEEGCTNPQLHGCESCPHGAAQARLPLLVDHDLDGPTGDAGSYLCCSAAQDDDHLLERRV